MKIKLLIASLAFSVSHSFVTTCANAQGTWAPLTSIALDSNRGVMLLLSDGTVMAKSYPGAGDTIGNLWDKLTPDIHGSYINGTWTRLAQMHYTRTYFSSQVLKDGRVFVAGGEYGTGNSHAETYDPLTDIWTNAPNPGFQLFDANSEILPDGRVLVSVFQSSSSIIYDPVSNTWSAAVATHGNADESAWVKLPDNSILFVDMGTTNSERYIPSLNQWVTDGTVPVSLYDSYNDETGAGFLLPDGRVFFLGSTGHTAYYTPSGNSSPGTWAAGPDIPALKGTPDAAAAMMSNGKILCAVSPAPKFLGDFSSPTTFYEFNYLTNTFTQVNAPGGGDSLNLACWETNMLDLPNGEVLFANLGAKQYYVYSPVGAPLTSGKPIINNFTQNGCTFTITGTLFNGISEGAAYGDDWQMASNYPIVQLTSGPNVYYARTFNWNRTGVQTGILPDTTQFTVPAGVPAGTYSLAVIANGNPSNPVSFNYTPCSNGIRETEYLNNSWVVYPNPTKGRFTIQTADGSGPMMDLKIEIYNVLGENIFSEGMPSAPSVLSATQTTVDISFIPSGVYFLKIIYPDGGSAVKKIIRE